MVEGAVGTSMAAFQLVKGGADRANSNDMVAKAHKESRKVKARGGGRGGNGSLGAVCSDRPEWRGQESDSIADAQNHDFIQLSRLFQYLEMGNEAGPEQGAGRTEQ